MRDVGLSEAEHYEICEEINQKIKEFNNPNLAEKNAKKIEICEVIFGIYLTRNGRLFLQEPTGIMESHRKMLLEKIAEFEPTDAARENAEYMETGGVLKELLGEINNRGARLADSEGGWW